MQFGQSLCVWFGSTCIGLDEDAEPCTFVDFPGSVFTYKEYEELSVSQRLILPWIVVSLRRELRKSCPILFDVVHEAGSSSAAESFRPFRMDYPETLLLSNICRTACFQMGTLTTLLSSLLLCISECPEDYVLPKSGGLDASPVKEADDSTDEQSVLMNRFNVCKLIVDRMRQQGSTMHTIFPPIVVLLLQCVRRESFREDKPEVFYASMVAILFLRLVCPALISPQESSLFSSWKSEPKRNSASHDNSYR